MAEWYLTHRFDELSLAFLEILDYFHTKCLLKLHPHTQWYLDTFLKNFFYFFTQEDYVISDAKVIQRFINFNSLIANLTSISHFRNTDPFLAVIANQKANFVKLLTLYNAYNTVRLDRKAFFDADPACASRWYYAFMGDGTGVVTRNSYVHLREHVAYVDDRLAASLNTNCAYMGATYVDPDADRGLKRHINAAIQRNLKGCVIKNYANPRKIGIFTSMWHPAHSVYRSQQPLLRALAPDYELTLVHLGKDRHDLATDLFTDVRRFQFGGDTSEISPNDFMVAYFPDIGISVESSFLANLRIAPIQISSYGHPVSTFGSRIDYWIGGQETEAAGAQEHYSERLVLIPGIGALPLRPQYTPANQQAPCPPILISCPWYQQKINYPLLALLKDVLRRSNRPVKFLFFPGRIALNNYLPINRFISEILGAEHVEVYPDLEYSTYMRTMEKSHFTIDSYPFGGYNTIVDSFHVRRPVVARRGDRFYNRAAACLNERVGLGELVADSDADYVAIITRLVVNDAFRNEVTARLEAADLDSLLFQHESNVDFKKAIDYLIANHVALQHENSRTPITLS